METAACKMTLQEKLNILADAAKYDVACVSATVFPRTDAASLC